jgi:serologically defined colon cancer antigen 8
VKNRENRPILVELFNNWCLFTSRKLFSSNKLDSPSPIYKKRGYDVTDYAYREAVDRLKYLLADNPSSSQMAPTKFYDKLKSTSAKIEEISDAGRPDVTEISKYMPGMSRHNSLRRLNYSSPLKEYGLKSAISMQNLHPPPVNSIAVAAQQPPQELLNFIEKQESYIEQLEKESHFCREGKSPCKKKIK